MSRNSISDPPPPPPPPADTGDLREVTSPDGTLAYRVPAHWHEAEEADGAHAFHDPGAQTGVLRVRLFTFSSEQKVAAGVARAQLEGMTPVPGYRIESLPDGAVLRTQREEAQAGSERTVVHLWMLAREQPPHGLRMVIFSLTVSKMQAGELDVRRVVREVDREVRAARLSGAKAAN